MRPDQRGQAPSSPPEPQARAAKPAGPEQGPPVHVEARALAGWWEGNSGAVQRRWSLWLLIRGRRVRPVESWWGTPVDRPGDRPGHTPPVPHNPEEWQAPLLSHQSTVPAQGNRHRLHRTAGPPVTTVAQHKPRLGAGAHQTPMVPGVAVGIEPAASWRGVRLLRQAGAKPDPAPRAAPARQAPRVRVKAAPGG